MGARHENADPGAGLVADLARHTVWVPGEAGPRLYAPPGVAWPRTPDRDRAAGYPPGDRVRLAPHLRTALLPREEFERTLAFCRVLTAALRLVPECVEDPRSRPVKILLCLALARAADQATALERGVVLDPALDTAREHAGSRVRLLTSALAPVLARDHTLNGLVDGSSRPARGRALARLHELVSGLGTPAGESEADLVPVLGLVGDLVRERGFDLETDLPFGPGRPGSAPHGVGSLPLRFLDVDLTRELSRELDSELGLTSSTAVDRDLDLALDLALARAVTSDAEGLHAVVAAQQILLGLWRRSPEAGPGQTKSLAAFDEFLSRAVGRPAAGRVSENPAVPLRRACLLLGLAPQGSPVPDRGDPDRGPGSAGWLLAELARALVGPLVDRTEPWHEPTLSSARFALLAAVAHLREGREHAVADLLEDALYGLIALQEREQGHLAPNELLVLVRA